MSFLKVVEFRNIFSTAAESANRHLYGCVSSALQHVRKRHSTTPFGPTSRLRGEFWDDYGWRRRFEGSLRLYDWVVEEFRMRVIVVFAYAWVHLLAKAIISLCTLFKVRHNGARATLATFLQHVCHWRFSRRFIVPLRWHLYIVRASSHTPHTIPLSFIPRGISHWGGER